MKVRAVAFAAALALMSPLLALGAPAALAAPTATGRAYVTEPSSSSVKVVDLGTNAVIDTIPIGSGFLVEATASPNGNLVYVSDLETTVWVIRTATNTVATGITVGSGPTGIAFAPNGAAAYVAGSTSDTVSVINTATNTVTATIPLQAGSFANEVAVTPDGTKVYVANVGLDTVSVISTATNTVIATIPVGGGPYDVAVSPVGNRAYVSNSGSNTVSVINTGTNTVVATIPVGQNPRGVAVSPDGAAVYAVNNDSYTASEISTATNTVTATIPTTLGAPIAVAVTSRRVYVTSFGGPVAVIDRAARSVIATIAMGGPEDSAFSWGIAVIPGTNPPPSATPTITTQASADNLVGAPVTDTATLSGGAGPTGSVIFRLFDDPACLNEVSTSTNPLVGGKATSSAFVPQAGTYYWRATYTGDANNNPAANPCQAPHESVVISPFAPPPFTRTLTGDVVGPVTVNAGESVQILNARVVGPVTVKPGGALTVTNSQISRGIVANAPRFLLICGTQVSGPSPGQALGVFDAPVPVRIGDQVRGCAGNRFAGSVNLINNTAQTFSNNVVAGNVTVNDGGPGPTLIQSNNVYGTLACSGNDPPPSLNRLLQRNTATAKTGQCAGVF